MDTRIVALLRGINVGSSKRVPMAGLRDLLGDLDYRDVSTLLNSGNALFTCSPKQARTAAADIERGVQRELGVECRVVVRTVAEFTAAINRTPLLDLMTDGSRYFVGFLDADATAAGQRAVVDTDVAPDRVELIDRELFLWCPKGLSASPLYKINWDRTLGCAVTMRNWKTVTKVMQALAASSA